MKELVSPALFQRKGLDPWMDFHRLAVVSSHFPVFHRLKKPCEKKPSETAGFLEFLHRTKCVIVCTTRKNSSHQPEVRIPCTVGDLLYCTTMRETLAGFSVEANSILPFKALKNKANSTINPFDVGKRVRVNYGMNFSLQQMWVANIKSTTSVNGCLLYNRQSI